MQKWQLGAGLAIVVLLIVFVGLNLNHKQPGINKPNPASAVATTTQQQTRIIDPNAAKFVGQANLKKYELIAVQNSNNVMDQVNAGESAFINKDFTDAIKFYKKAVQLQPKSAEYVTYLGNVYYRGLNQPQAAAPYYQKATQVNPTYAYGWANLAAVEATLGNMSGAKDTLQRGVKSVSPQDPMFSVMQKEISALH